MIRRFPVQAWSEDVVFEGRQTVTELCHSSIQTFVDESMVKMTITQMEDTDNDKLYQTVEIFVYGFSDYEEMLTMPVDSITSPVRPDRAYIKQYYRSEVYYGYDNSQSMIEGMAKYTEVIQSIMPF